MKPCGVLFLALLTCCVAVENFNPSVPVARHLNSRIKRQNTGGDPNLEGIFGQQNQNGNLNPPQFGNTGQSGQSSSSSNERPQFGFGFSGLDQGSSNNNGGVGGFGNVANNNQNQGSSSNLGGGQGTLDNGGFGGFGNNQNQGSSNNAGGFNNFGGSQGSIDNGGFSSNQGSLGGSGSNTQNVQRPQTTQRSPLNQISLQTTINDADCLRGCRNRLTQQYNPVCGSDNISYSNQQVFDCYNRECRKNVTVRYHGSCVTTRAPNSN